MAEQVSIGIGLALWEYVVKPIVDSAKDEYGENVKGKLKSVVKKFLHKLPFEKNELEIIEAEILEIDDKLFSNKDKFLGYINDNQNINQIMEIINGREENLNIEKSFNDVKIDGDNNQISF